MPLTIKELHVRMVVDENTSNPTSSSKKTGNNNVIAEDKLIEKCVEVILQILEDKNEK